MATNSTSERQHQEQLERQKAFLAALRGDNGVPRTIRAACAEAGVSRTTVRRWRDDDAAFREAYEDAFEDGTDTLEDEAVRRAVRGVEEPVFMKDANGDPGVVGHKTRYSDDLMKFMLAGRRPATFRQGVTVVNNNLNAAGLGTTVDDQQLARALALLIAQGEHKQLNGKSNGSGSK